MKDIAKILSNRYGNSLELPRLEMLLKENFKDDTIVSNYLTLVNRTGDYNLDIIKKIMEENWGKIVSNSNSEIYKKLWKAYTNACKKSNEKQDYIFKFLSEIPDGIDFTKTNQKNIEFFDDHTKYIYVLENLDLSNVVDIYIDTTHNTLEGFDSLFTPNLKSLMIDGKNLSSLSGFTNHTNNITNLVMQHFNFDFLPELSKYNFNNLTELDIRYNNLNSVENLNMVSPKLKFLELSYNNLETIDALLNKNYPLEEIVAVNNPIKDGKSILETKFPTTEIIIN